MLALGLPESERRSLDAPKVLDGLGCLTLSLFGHWRGDAIFVLVTACIDESGTGGDPRILVGALVSRASRWHGFYRGWTKLLAKEGIEFSHIVAMEKGEAPFAGWDGARTRNFVRQTTPLLGRYIDFGVTVAADVADYRASYREPMQPKASPDSPYGVCARQAIIAIMQECVNWYGDDVRVNYVFENSHLFGGAKKVFDELKGFTDGGRNLGTIVPGEKAEYAGLQGADIVASLGRRQEPKAAFRPVSDRREYKREPFPLLHFDLKPNALEILRTQTEAIALERRGRKRVKGFAKRSRLANS